MNTLDYKKFIVPVITLFLVLLARYVFKDIFTIDYADLLIILGCITIIDSFDFVHTLLGQNASRTNKLNDYLNVSNDMKYYDKKDRGYTLENLIVGILELIIGVILLFI